MICSKLCTRLVVAGALFLQLAAAALRIIDLTEQTWTLASPDNDVSVRGKVPSHAHVDLYNAGVIEDPLARLNEYEVRWVSYSNWTYTADIQGLHVKENQSTYLVFNGLDTYSSIEFCEQHIASTDNQFRQYVFDVSEALRSCGVVGNGTTTTPLNSTTTTRLTVNFGPASNISEAIANEPGQQTWPKGINMVYQYSHREFVRKEQNDFGWDWGPALVPAGIWQPAWIVQLDSPDSLYVKNSDFDLYREGQLNNLSPDQNTNWVFNASVDVVGNVPEGARMKYTFLDPDASDRVVSSGELSGIENGGDVITGVIKLDQNDFELWWPSGLGPQKLYDVKVEVVWRGKTIASVDKRMGFRTIVVNMEPISQEQLAQGIMDGANWHFEINGHEFYAKGANFVPPDPFWPRVTEQDIKAILDDVINANMNMLRLWSSGAYVPDFMYDMADEMGLMLWSEFQFSVSLYPTSPTFLENVRQEAVYQTRRVNHHPSLAVWAGGNEMEKGQLPAIRKNFPDQYERYLNEYIELFLNTLLPAVYGNSRSIGYMPCSTNNGYLYLDHSLPIPFVNRFYNLTEGKLYGDSDYYDYDAANAFDIDTYVVNRFANEFGFPSMPTIESWREAGLPEDQLRFNSTMVVLRSRHYPPGNLDTDRMDPPLRGQHEMTKGVELWYPIPNKADPIANFSAWCHTTQVFQADFYRAKIQYYRAGSGMPQRQLGALYWQLNDIWSAPTWSGREKSGRWKAMFYAAKDAFQPVILAPVFNVTSGLLDLYAVSELWSDVTGEVSWQWIGYDGEPVVPSNRWPELKPSGGAVGAGRTNFTVGAVNSTVLMTLNMTELTAEGGPLPSDNAILVADLQATGTQPNTDATKTYTHSTYFTAGPLSSAKLVDPGLTLEREDGAFTVTATEGVSAFTWLATDPELDSGVIVVFEDNGFLLRKGESKTVGYRVVGAGSEGWEERVRVSSIWDNTQPY